MPSVKSQKLLDSDSENEGDKKCYILQRLSSGKI